MVTLHKNNRLVTTFCIILIIILASVLSQVQANKLSFTVTELLEISAEEIVYDVSTADTNNLNFSGYRNFGNFELLNDKNNKGAYFANLSESLEIIYYPQNGGSDNKSIVYTSQFPIVAYKTFAIAHYILLLEMYFNSDDELSFNLLRIGHDYNFESVDKIFSDTCEKLPYLHVANLRNDHAMFMFENYSTEPQLERRILLNYDTNGKSYLILLNNNFGPANVNNIVATGEYEYFEDGNLGVGKRIIFCGGYGDYIYYQAVYNTLGDPYPEIANFESQGKSVLYRYHIIDETIEKIWSLDEIFLQHVNANGNIALISEQNYYIPLPENLKIVSLRNENKYFVIPGIKSGEDINKSYFVSENKFVFHTYEMLYFADLEKNFLYVYSLDDETNIHFNDIGVSFTRTNQDGAPAYYIVSYENIFIN